MRLTWLVSYISSAIRALIEFNEVLFNFKMYSECHFQFSVSQNHYYEHRPGEIKTYQYSLIKGKRILFYFMYSSIKQSYTNSYTGQNKQMYL